MSNHKKPQNDLQFNHSLEKEYCMEPLHAYVIGIVLMFMSLFPFIVTSAIAYPFETGFLNFLLSFIFSSRIIGTAFFMIFFVTGLLFIKDAKRIIVAKIDHKGLYFKRLNRWREEGPFLVYFKKKFVFIPFSELKKAEYVKRQYEGDRVKIDSNFGSEDLWSFTNLSSSSKHEIVEVLNRQIKKHNSIRS